MGGAHRSTRGPGAVRSRLSLATEHTQDLEKIGVLLGQSPKGAGTGMVLRCGVLSLTYPESAIEGNDPHNTSVAVFQHACPIVIRPALCTRNFLILAFINALFVFVRFDKPECISQGRVAQIGLGTVARWERFVQSSDCGGAFAVDGFVSGRPIINVATR